MGLPIKQDGKAYIFFFTHAALLLLKIKEVNRKTELCSYSVLMGGRKTQNCYCKCSPRLQGSSVFKWMESYVLSEGYYAHSPFPLVGFARVALWGRSAGAEGRAALTDGAHVPAVRCHHERRPAGAVGRVHPRAVAQQQLQALHVVCEGCGVQGRPGGNTHTARATDTPTSPKTSQCKRF